VVGVGGGGFRTPGERLVVSRRRQGSSHAQQTVWTTRRQQETARQRQRNNETGQSGRQLCSGSLSRIRYDGRRGL